MKNPMGKILSTLAAAALVATAMAQYTDAIVSGTNNTRIDDNAGWTSGTMPTGILDENATHDIIAVWDGTSNGNRTRNILAVNLNYKQNPYWGAPASANQFWVPDYANSPAPTKIYFAGLRFEGGAAGTQTIGSTGTPGAQATAPNATPPPDPSPATGGNPGWLSIGAAGIIDNSTAGVNISLVTHVETTADQIWQIATSRTLTLATNTILSLGGNVNAASATYTGKINVNSVAITTNGTVTRTFSANEFVMQNNQSFTFRGANDIVMSGNVQLNGGNSFNAAMDSATGKATFTGNIVFNTTNALTFSGGSLATIGEISIAGNISNGAGTGRLIIGGYNNGGKPVVVELLGNNSFTGGVDVPAQAGASVTIRIGSSTAFGIGGAFTYGNGTTILDTSLATGKLTMDHLVRATASSGNTIRFTGNNSLEFTQGYLNNSGGGTRTFNNQISGGATLTFSGGNFVLSATGAATPLAYTFSGGGTTIIDGDMTSLNGLTDTLNISGTGTTLYINKTTYYTGLTTINTGATLAGEGTIAGPVSVATGATLDFSGTVKGNLTTAGTAIVKGGGKFEGTASIATGASINITDGLTFGNGLTLTGGAAAVGATVLKNDNSAVTVSGGTLTLASGTNSISLKLMGALTDWEFDAGYTTTIFSFTGAGALAGTSLWDAGHVLLSADQGWATTGVTFSQDSNGLYLNGLRAVIPEPSTYLLLGASLLALVIFRRRK